MPNVVRLPRSLTVLVCAGLLMTSVNVVAAPAGWDEPPPSGGSNNSVNDGADPDAPHLSLGSQWMPYSVAPGQLGAVPQVMYFDDVVDGVRTKKTYLAAARGPDSPTVEDFAPAKLVAHHNAAYFEPFEDDDFANFSSSAKLSDGTVLAMGFIPKSTPSPHRFGLPNFRSNDQGRTWKKSVDSLVENKWKLDWYRSTGRRIIELDDGTLLHVVYGAGTIDGKKGAYSIIVQSTDGGYSWTQRSIIDPAGGTNEVGLAQTSDGRLIAVTRGPEPFGGGTTEDMGVYFSSDDGVSWEPRTTYAPPSGLPANGIMPDVVLQPNGVLVLSYGRPDNYVAVSYDGTGRTWDAGKLVYSNHVRAEGRGRVMGSSGNTALTPGFSNSSMMYGDMCHNTWSCGEHNNLNGIWAQRVDAVTPGTGKIDLATGITEGTISVTGRGTVPSDDRFPEQRVEGAVDGSSEFRAAARFPDAGAKGQDGIVLKLDREYDINRIGLMLDRGRPNSAKIQVSTDGKTWSDPVVRQRNSVDYAVRYHDLDKPVRASYVKVTHDGSVPLTAITELEIYSDRMTFENDAPGATPRGLTDTLHAFVMEPIVRVNDNGDPMTGAHSRQRLALVDNDDFARATATFPVTSSNGLTADFDWSGQGYGSGAIWEVLGVDDQGESVVAQRLHVASDAKNKRFVVSAWNGSAWVQVGVIPTWKPNWTWMPVTITSSGTEVTVAIGGQQVTSTVHTAPAVSLTGFRASTGLEEKDINMEHGYDNVLVRSTS